MFYFSDAQHCLSCLSSPFTLFLPQGTNLQLKCSHSVKVENNLCPVKLIQSKCIKKELPRKQDRHCRGNCNSLVCSKTSHMVLCMDEENMKMHIGLKVKHSTFIMRGGWLKRPHQSHLKRNKRTIHWINMFPIDFNI